MGRDDRKHYILPPKDHCFNPRARMGRDLRGETHVLEGYSFNPRARMGRDFRWIIDRHVGGCFNPRARMGRDKNDIGIKIAQIVSIHAPAWGATRTFFAVFASINGFNPRARMGRDAGIPVFKNHSNCFNPRARMGRDDCSVRGFWLFLSFNPRARMGRDLPVNL